MIALAWRNLWRQPRRTVLTLLAIAFACLVMVFLLALQVGTYASMKENTMSVFDGYAQIQTPDYLADPGIRKSFEHPDELARSIGKVPGIDTVATRAQTYALLSSGSHSLATMIVGVQPEAERRVSRLAATVHSGHYLMDGTAAEVVLGEALARNLHVRVGGKVTLLGMGRDGSVAADVLSVVGIFSSGVKELDRQLAEMPLSRFQSDFAMPNQAHMLVLSGASLGAVDQAIGTIQHRVAAQGLRVRDWGELEPGLKSAIQLDAGTSTMWYVALVVVAIAILINTFFMSVLERTREFGILLALGMRPAVAGRMVWLEFLLLLALGIALGTAAGAAVAGWYALRGLALPGAEGVFAQWGLPGLMYPKLTAFSVLTGPTALAVIGALSGLFPLIRLHRLEPVTAMRAA